MVKASAQNTVADSKDTEETTEPTSPRVIAEWIGSESSPRVDRRTAREITKKQAKDNLLMTVTRDLKWTHATAYRADITDEPDSFKEWIGGQAEFKVTEED